MTLTPRLDRLDRNLLINGNFDFWQRGVGPTNVTGAVNTADRWRPNLNTGTGTSSRSTDVPNARSKYSMLLSCNAVNAKIYQRIESNFIRDLAGKTATFSVYIKCGDATETPISVNFSYPTLENNYTAETSIQTTVLDAAPISGVWTKYTLQIDLPSNVSNGMVIYLSREAGSAAVTETYFSQACLVEGDFEEVEFCRAGRDYAEELRLCQRYYEKSYDLDTPPGSTVDNGDFQVAGINSTTPRFPTKFTVTKRANPTFTTYSPATGTANRLRDVIAGADRTQIGDSSGINSARTSWSGTANNETRWHWTADAEI